VQSYGLAETHACALLAVVRERRSPIAPHTNARFSSILLLLFYWGLCSLGSS
jgi:hypothetical protein